SGFAVQSSCINKAHLIIFCPLLTFCYTKKDHCMESIFLLEDDQTLGRGIVMALEAPGRTVTLAGSLREGRAVLAGERFDLLILDINLPDGSGLELLRRLRAASDRTPVILLTA